jgi:hypothetical protein
MTDIRATAKLNESEIVEAIEYMYGISYKEANRRLEEGHYTREEIYKAVAYFRTAQLKRWLKD